MRLSAPSQGLGPEPVRRVFLTGAAGFVGRNLIRHFTASGSEVVGLIRTLTQADLISSLGAVPIVGDVLDPSVEAGIAGCDALIHAAADTDHGRGGEGQRRVNEDGTRNIFSAAQKAGVRSALHLSSESVLADGQPLINVDERRPYPKRPAGSYSRSKQTAERLALGFDGPDMRVCVLRPRMVWGRDDSTGLPMLVTMARAGKLAWIGGGTYLTTTTHIANLCQAVELAFARGRGGEIYFVGDEAPSEFRSFVGEMLQSQGIDPPTKTVPRRLVRMLAELDRLLAAISAGRLSGPLTMQAYAASAVEITLDTRKAQRELGYAPLITRKAGMEELRAAAVSSQ